MTGDEKGQKENRNRASVREKGIISADFPLSRSQGCWCSLSVLWTTQTAASSPLTLHNDFKVFCYSPSKSSHTTVTTQLPSVHMQPCNDFQATFSQERIRSPRTACVLPHFSANGPLFPPFTDIWFIIISLLPLIFKAPVSFFFLIIQ